MGTEQASVEADSLDPPSVRKSRGRGRLQRQQFRRERGGQAAIRYGECWRAVRSRRSRPRQGDRDVPTDGEAGEKEILTENSCSQPGRGCHKEAGPSPFYLRRRARRTVAVPATSVIPLIARAGSISGARGGGVLAVLVFVVTEQNLSEAFGVGASARSENQSQCQKRVLQEFRQCSHSLSMICTAGITIAKCTGLRLRLYLAA